MQIGWWEFLENFRLFGEHIFKSLFKVVVSSSYIVVAILSLKINLSFFENKLYIYIHTHTIFPYLKIMLPFGDLHSEKAQHNW